MSRIGNAPITIPAGVEVKVDGNNFVEVTGAKGKLSEQMSREMKIVIEENIITVARPTENKKHKSLHGLTRTLISNMVVGVSEGYSKTLEIVGVGYRGQKKGNQLILNLGYSHLVEMVDPDGIETELPNQNTIIVKGIDKQQVGNYAAVIRAWRKPEPYKGKGIKYQGEKIRRKEGKTGK